jgi:energy-coupling factor transporter ATP-binding protein EcfA2
MELLKLVGLEEDAHKLPAAVSGGQQQSAAIARALANDPPIIIADEPTGNLDSRTAEAVFELFLELTERGKTIVMITHDSHLAARMSRYILLSDGELVHPAIARAFPGLPHHMMLRATHLLQLKTYQPGTNILRQGEENRTFFVITKGEVEVYIKPRRRKDEEVTVATLGPGEFFGEVELIRGGKNMASVQASPEGPVEVGVLNRETFMGLVNASNITEAQIAEIVQKRLDENKVLSKKRSGILW